MTTIVTMFRRLMITFPKFRKIHQKFVWMSDERIKTFPEDFRAYSEDYSQQPKTAEKVRRRYEDVSIIPK